MKLLDIAGRNATKRGEGAVQQMQNYTFLCNCPPPGVKFESKAFCCNHARICPMCYARRIVTPVYQAVEYAWYMGREEHVLADSTRLVVIRSEHDLPLSRNSVSEYVEKMRKSMVAHADAVENLGAVCITTLSPGCDPEGKRSKDYLRFRRSTILCTHQSVSLAEVQARKGVTVKFIESGELTKEHICDVVAWAARYPMGMMFGDATLACEIYDATAARRVKTYCTTGIFAAG